MDKGKSSIGSKSKFEKKISTSKMNGKSKSSVLTGKTKLNTKKLKSLISLKAKKKLNKSKAAKAKKEVVKENGTIKEMNEINGVDEISDTENNSFFDDLFSDENEDNDFEGFFRDNEKPVGRISKEIPLENETPSPIKGDKIINDDISALEKSSIDDDVSVIDNDEDDIKIKEAVNGTEIADKLNASELKELNDNANLILNEKNAVHNKLIERIMNNKDLSVNLDSGTLLQCDDISESEALNLARLSVSSMIKSLSSSVKPKGLNSSVTLTVCDPKNSEDDISIVNSPDININDESEDEKDGLSGDESKSLTCSSEQRSGNSSEVHSCEVSPVKANDANGSDIEILSDNPKSEDRVSGSDYNTSKDDSNSPGEISRKISSECVDISKASPGKEDTSAAAEPRISDEPMVIEPQLSFTEPRPKDAPLNEVTNEQSTNCDSPNNKLVIAEPSATTTDHSPRNEFSSTLMDDDFCDESGKDKEASSMVEEDSYLEMMIPAEVVMSELSDNEDGHQSRASGSSSLDDQPILNTSLQKVSTSESSDDILTNFISSFKKSHNTESENVFHTHHTAVPQFSNNREDMTRWQLQDSSLPTFTPTNPTPDWIRMTIPPEGYKCPNCMDSFLLESSIKVHLERKSVLITLECGPCDAKLTFYNKCAMRAHLRVHIEAGEDIDDDTVEVSVLPLEQTPLLQPYYAPVPKFNRKESALNFFDYREGSKNVKCLMCDKSFPTVRSLMSHMQTDRQYSTQRVECRKCSLVLPSICAAKAHILTHPPANLSNALVCPECGESCESPREYIYHSHSCGHQMRQSGILCAVCKVSFFKTFGDFLSHWVKEHCNKSYECLLCGQLFESLVFHSCTAPGEEVLGTFKCILACPACDDSVVMEHHETHLIHQKIEEHLKAHHSKMISKVYYIFKSNFCANAFRSKDELRVHHDREHRRDNHYRSRSCSLMHDINSYQSEYAIPASDTANAFISIPILLNRKEKEDAQLLKVPTVTSIIDKNVFPDNPSFADPQTGQQITIIDGIKVDSHSGKPLESLTNGFENEYKLGSTEPRTYVCYKCGVTHHNKKLHRKHTRKCEVVTEHRVCRVCNSNFKGRAYIKHCEVHMAQGSIICMLCNALQFDSIKKLYQHFEKHAHEQFHYPEMCPLFNVQLRSVTGALEHLKNTHRLISASSQSSTSALTPVTPSFRCEKCCRSFQEKRGLSVHLLTCGSSVNSISVRKCLACSRCISQESIGKHMVSHLQEGVVLCCLCDGKTFSSNEELSSHLEMVHASGDLFPESCVLCQKIFSDSHTALRHLKEEHGLCELPCTECEMKYTFSQQLTRHMEIVHMICQYAKRRYICWICRAYDHVKKETLLNHFLTVHGIQRWQVIEQIMIRTRGQGTMPTAQFVPTKQIKRKSATSKLIDSPPSSKANSPPPVKLSKEKTSETTAEKKSPSNNMKSPERKELSSPAKEESHPPSTEEILADAIDEEESLVESSIQQQIIKVDIKEVLQKSKQTVPKSTVTNESEDSPNEESGKKRPLEIDETDVNMDVNQDQNKKPKSLEVIKPDTPRPQASSSIPAYNCEECGAKFVVKISLMRHMFFEHKIKMSPEGLDKSPKSVKRPFTVSDALAEKKIKLECLEGLSCEGDLPIPDPLKNLPKISAQNPRSQPIILNKSKSTGILKSHSLNASLDSNRVVKTTSPVISKTFKPGTPPIIRINKTSFEEKKVRDNSPEKLKSNPIDNGLSNAVQNETITDEPHFTKIIKPQRSAIKLTSSILKKPDIIKILPSSSTKNILKMPSIQGNKPLSITISRSSLMSNLQLSQPSKITVEKSSNASSDKNPTVTYVSTSNLVKTVTSLSSSNGNVISTGKVKPTFSMKLLSSQCSKSATPIVLARSLSTGSVIASPVNLPALSPKPKPDQPTEEIRLITSESPSEADEDLLGSHECEVCGDAFGTEGEMTSHMRTHGMAFLELEKKKKRLSSSSEDISFTN